MLIKQTAHFTLNLQKKEIPGMGTGHYLENGYCFLLDFGAG
jgi:hypothetical protein